MNIYNSITQNKTKSFFIVGFFTIFVALVTYVIAYVFDLDFSIVPLALIFGGLGSFLSYWFSDKIILAISSARPANKEEDYYFTSVTENLVMVAGIPRPKLYVITDTAMNAFATGRNPENAVVCCTSGLLSRLNRTELEGVVAHELSHIKNYDMLLMSIVTILVGFLTLISDILLRSSWGRRNRSRDKSDLGPIILVIGLVLTLLSPIIAQLIQFAISRRREFLADASAVKLTRQPSGLINALIKISQDKEPLEAANKATAHLYITNPLKNWHSGVGWFANLFNTHPPIETRIEVLKQL